MPRVRIAAAALAGTVALTAATGCLAPHRDYEKVADRYKMKPHVTDELGHVYRDVCHGDRGCVAASLRLFNFGTGAFGGRIPGEPKQNFFYDRDLAEAFMYVSGDPLNPSKPNHVWFAMNGLAEVATDGGLCLTISPVPGQDWGAEPC